MMLRFLLGVFVNPSFDSRTSYWNAVAPRAVSSKHFSAASALPTAGRRCHAPCRGDMRNVDQRMFELVTIEALTAWAPHKRVWLLRGQPLAGFPHGIFPAGPSAGIPPLLKIRLGSVRQEHPPRLFEAGAR